MEFGSIDALVTPPVVTTPKKATNITLSADVLNEAKALGINISQACDHFCGNWSRASRSGAGRLKTPNSLRPITPMSRARGCLWICGGLSDVARFEVFRNSGAHADDVPYLPDVQSDLLHGLETRVVIPLRRRDRFPASRIPLRLTPVFEIEGTDCLLETPKLAAVPLRLLKQPVLSLSNEQTTITGALNFLFQGF
jgi:toxin CcdB